MLNIELSNAILLILVGGGAGFVQRVSGFGLGIFAMLFLPHFMPSHSAAAAISCLFSCGSSGYNTVKYRKYIPYKTLIPVLCAAAVTIPVAVFYAASVSERFFKILLGIVLIVLSFYFLFFNHRITLLPTMRNGILAGAFGGTLSGLFSTGGPPVVLYLSHATTDMTAYFSGMQFYFFLTNMYATAARVLKGVITWELLVYALIGFSGCMAGDWVGSKVFQKLNAAKLKTVIYIGMIISGILMIV